jgi:hypothetical protein
VDLRVDKPGVIIDRVMQERVSGGLALLVALTGLCTQEPPAPAIRDPAKLLHVDVDQITRGCVLVTALVGP